MKRIEKCRTVKALQLRGIALTESSSVVSEPIFLFALFVHLLPSSLMVGEQVGVMSTRPVKD